MSMPVQSVKTEIEGVLEFHAHAFPDDRGFFMETYNVETWGNAGFGEVFKQDCLSASSKGTLRGMHYQMEPRAMGKLVRVVKGAVFDVAVDLRQGSPTFGQWVGRELTAENKIALWVPVGFAHGFVALADDTLVYYKCTDTYNAETERSLSYKDPEVGIAWPIPPTHLTEKDEQAPLLKDAEYNFTYSA